MSNYNKNSYSYNKPNFSNIKSLGSFTVSSPAAKVKSTSVSSKSKSFSVRGYGLAFRGTVVVALIMILFSLSYPLLLDDTLDDFQRGEIVIDKFFDVIGLFASVGNVVYKSLTAFQNSDLLNLDGPINGLQGWQTSYPEGDEGNIWQKIGWFFANFFKKTVEGQNGH